MVTIKDIAKLAGVSHGTVSNVINKKGNVSVDKIRLVEQAAAELGYSANAQAQLLRKESNRCVALILPNMDTEPCQTLYRTLSEHLREHGYEVFLYLSGNLTDREKERLETALSIRPAAIVAMSCAPNPESMYDVGVKVFLIDHQSYISKSNIRSYSFDYGAAAQDIAGRLKCLKATNAACFVNAQAMPADKQLLKYLVPALALKEIRMELFSGDESLLANSAFEIVSSEPPYDAIISGNLFRTEKLKTIAALYGKPLPPVITLTPAQALPDYGTTCYQLDYAALSRTLAEAIAAPESVKTQQPFTQLPCKGFCGDLFGVRAAPGGEQLTLITLASPTSQALVYLEPLFYRQTGMHLNIIALPHSEMYDSMRSGSLGRYDLIRLDLVWLNRFESLLCAPLDPKDPAVKEILASFLPSVLKAYVSPDKTLYTLPFDPSTQMMYYRKDLFDDAKLKRLYFEMNHERLKVPTDFEQYNKVAAFFTKSINPASPVPYGTTMTYGSAAVAACDFLPRLRGMGGSIFDGKGRLHLTADTVRSAMDGYARTRQYAHPGVAYWWMNSMEVFSSGQTAMTTVFINHASAIINSRKSSMVGKVGATALPGNRPLLGGGCIGISRESKKTEACMAFLKWVYSDEIATLLTLLGGLTACKTPYQNEEVLRLYPWLRQFDACIPTADRQNKSPLYPDFDDYQFEILLGMAVRNVVLGTVTPEEALSQAQALYEHENGRAAGG